MTTDPNPVLLDSHDSDHSRPTLKTIAAETGLAIATVSRALNDAPDIGEETKRRVRETAARLGYRPNRAGVRLRTGKTNVIGLVLSTEADVMNHNAQLIYAIAAAVRNTAYHLVVMPFFGDEDPMAPIRYIVETGSADGIIINQTKPDDARVRYLVERGFPFTAHGRTNMRINHSYFDFDNEAYARLGARALAKRQRRRLFLVPPPREQTYSGHMITGFSDEAALCDATFEIAQSVSTDVSSEQIEQAVFQRCGKFPRPDGFLVGSTPAAMATVNGAERAGMRLGVDFDLVAKEVLPFLRQFRKEILVVREDIKKAGDFLARALVAAIENGAAEENQFLDQPTSIDTGEGPA